MHFTDPMPRQIRRGHPAPGMPEWTGDRARKIPQQAAKLAAARKAGKPLPPNALDMNFHWFWRDPADHTKGGNHRNMHNRSPLANNYRHLLNPDGKTTRRMTVKELRRTIWADGEVARWRRTSDPDSEHPSTYQSLATLGHHHEIYVCAELKSPNCANPRAAQGLVTAAHYADHPPWGMALLNMRNARGKCEAHENAGGQFALIFGRLAAIARKPADWAHWHPKPTRIWNHSKRLLAWLS